MIIDKAKDRADRAREFLENGQYREAASAFISLGDYASAARALVCARDYKEAAKNYEKAQKLLDAAKLYLLVREWQKAADLFSLAGDEIRAEVARDQLKKVSPEVLKSDTPKPASEEIEEEPWPQNDIFRALKNGDVNIAVNLYLKQGAVSGWSLLSEPMPKSALSALAEMFLMARDYSIAGDAFKKLGNEKKAAECYSLGGLYEDAADLYVRCGESELAAHNFEKAHQFDKAGKIHFEEGRFVEAARCYEKLNDPVKAAGMYLKANKSDLALPLLQSIQPSHQHFAQCRLLAGKILFQKGKRELALSLIEPLLHYDTLSDSSLDILYQVAGLLEFGKEYDRAKEVYLKIQKARFGYKDVEKKIEALSQSDVQKKQPIVSQSITTEEMVETNALRECSLLDRLTLEDLRKLSTAGTILHPKMGEMILKKGEQSKGLYIVLEGGISITSDPGNPKSAVGFVTRGDYFGLGALVKGPSQPNTLISQNGTKLFFIPKDDLEHLVTTELELGLKLYRSIAEHLVQTMVKMSSKR